MEKCEKFSFYWQRCSQSPSISLFHPQMGKVGHFLQKAGAPWWKGKGMSILAKVQNQPPSISPTSRAKLGHFLSIKLFSLIFHMNWHMGCFRLRTNYGKSAKPAAKYFPNSPWKTGTLSTFQFALSHELTDGLFFLWGRILARVEKHPEVFFLFFSPSSSVGWKKTHSFNLKWEKYDGTLSTKLSIVLYILQS